MRDKTHLEETIRGFVKGQFTKNLIDWSLQKVSEGKFQLEFSINQKKLDEMEGELGLRVLMTDRHDWDTVDIIKAYYGQSMIEHAFRNLKNPYHLALKPQFHWTDQKIKVHFFICVLGYLLASIGGCVFSWLFYNPLAPFSKGDFLCHTSYNLHK